MAGHTPEYWPFAFPDEGERSELQRQLHPFLVHCHREGLRPCKFAEGEYRIESTDDRSAWLVYRGRLGGSFVTRWEIWLNRGTERMQTLRVEGFNAAASLVKDWVSGNEVDTHPPIAKLIEPLVATAS